MPRVEVLQVPTFLDESVRPLFSMELLESCDTSYPDEMAKRLLDTYVLNARAVHETSRVVAAEYFPADSVEHYKVMQVARQFARNNLATVAEELGSRTLMLTELLGQVAIEDQDFRHVKQAIGTPNIHSTNPLLRLAPARNADTLRIFDHPPHTPASPPPGLKWWDALVVSPRGNPLIRIGVLARGSRL